MLPLRQGQLAHVLCLFSTYKKMQNKELGRTDHVDHKFMFYIFEQCGYFLSVMKKSAAMKGLNNGNQMVNDTVLLAEENLH